ncbi:hypothetical protein BBO99_00001515 [Phytophthora kernoviae]|uniref:Uncharacterized protein n=1 Tax=Phytophthora kernoviae TaxID=325452 RepID=A0A3F2S0P9_9STRA|nr:hypothetical protein BBI17_001338 [Phytophthora kernoviae]RLN60741.1 hypothetical protein BBJ29_007144 [Phytophthora kernoviae]RLN68002.1 hypothetical protein BBP00_00001260 [Phytophthora kernoviae]RLN84196.1 hypothetical protein BBO99_00001515 [Phytophthora kernoviae]
MLATPGTSTAATSQRHLQGLVARRTAAAEPKNAAQYFGHVADVVSANEALAKTRTYNLRRCTKVAYRGYEAVLNRKKRAVLSHNVKPSAVNMLTARSVEQIKMEHSFQLHRLMQQQYREIQVLQQRYAECRLVNPTALSGIQKELSKLRLVHLSQVQTLKSKQALDMIGK